MSHGVCNRCVPPQGLSIPMARFGEFSWDFYWMPVAWRLHGCRSVRRRRYSPGFSLVELMVVVVIISVLAALVLPAMGQAMRERHVQQAAMTVMDVFRQVRSRAMYRGRAQMLVVQTSGTAALRFDAYEGSTSSCRMSTFGSSTGVLLPSNDMLTFDLSAQVYAADNINAVFTLPSSVSYLQVCYTPTGNAFFSMVPGTTPTTAIWSNDPTVVGSGGAFEIDVYQAVGGPAGGVPRRVLIPIGGIPRLKT